MMMKAKDVARIVHLNGGQLVGKTRLQKSAYFLEAKGLGFGIDFSYYRYGPYSEDLANFADDAKNSGLIDIEWKTSSDGAKYAVFRSLLTGFIEDQSDTKRRRVLEILEHYSAVEVELAATAHFLSKNGYATAPWEETKRRKSSKADTERLNRARQLFFEVFP